MISPDYIGVCEYHKPKNKVVCKHLRGYRCCDPYPCYSLKRNHIVYKMKCIYHYTVNLLTNKYHLDVSESEKKWIIFNRKTTFCGKYRISLTDNFRLCGNRKHL